MKLNVGATGESIAAEYLENNGFTVLERNYSQTVGEIDIVCRKGRIVHFVEVKTTAYPSRKKLEEDVSYETYQINARINEGKMQNLRKVISIYNSERKFKGTYIIDALFVYLVPYETYAAVEVVEDIEAELMKGDDWDFE